MNKDPKVWSDIRRLGEALRKSSATWDAVVLDLDGETFTKDSLSLIVQNVRDLELWERGAEHVYEREVEQQRSRADAAVLRAAKLARKLRKTEKRLADAEKK